MHKIIYKNITTNNNLMLVVQALIDKQNEIVHWINKHRTLVEKSPEEIERIGKYVNKLHRRELNG